MGFLSFWSGFSVFAVEDEISDVFLTVVLLAA